MANDFPGSGRHTRPTRWTRPLLFYLITWLSTTWVGMIAYGNGTWASGLFFSIPLMTILTCHELGHYIQTRRYRVPASLPLFIPLPLPPFGTMGAIIRMDASIPNIKALYDIGISGPLAGLVPTLIFLVLGISLSSLEPLVMEQGGILFGEPLLFYWVSSLFFDRSLPGMDLVLHPIGMAAWTGLFLTSLNLIPLSQLDGGHVFYALLKKKAGYFSLALFGTIGLVVILFAQWQWSLLLVLVAIFGVEHPPTCDDSPDLGRARKLLGWSTLAFILIGFTPTPIIEMELPQEAPKPVYRSYSLRDPGGIATDSLTHNVATNSFLREPQL
ncbi:MAG: site-2 protease family protein [Planctomycetia bacterium]|nr:site-2 protease family protein [Planctomycetia bacterium]